MSEWLDLVKKTMKENPGLGFKEVLKIAKKNYKKGSSSGAESKNKTIKVKKSKSGKKAKSMKKGKKSKSKKSKKSGKSKK